MAWTERYVRTDAAGGGDGTTDANSGGTGSWTLDEAITNAAGGMRINIKAGTYAYTATKALANAGSETGPIWWRGFNATIGDLDTVNVNTNFPWLDFNGDFRLGLTGASNWISNLTITSANTTASTGSVDVTAANCRIIHCHVTGEAADVDSRAIYVSSTGDNCVIRSCFLTAPVNANCVQIDAYADTHIIGCVLSGGLNGISTQSRGLIYANIFDGQAADAVAITAGLCQAVIGNSIYNPASDGVAITATVPGVIVANNVIEGCGAYGITVSSSSSYPTILNNSFYDNTSGDINNMYESFYSGSQTESASPYTNAGSDNFTLVGTALAKQAGFPGQWLNNSSTTNYLDIGAVQLTGASSKARTPRMELLQ